MRQYLYYLVIVFEWNKRIVAQFVVSFLMCTPLVQLNGFGVVDDDASDWSASLYWFSPNQSWCVSRNLKREGKQLGSGQSKLGTTLFTQWNNPSTAAIVSVFRRASESHSGNREFWRRVDLSAPSRRSWMVQLERQKVRFARRVYSGAIPLSLMSPPCWRAANSATMWDLTHASCAAATLSWILRNYYCWRCSLQALVVVVQRRHPSQI